MRLTFIGTGAATPSLKRGAPSLLLQEGGSNMVLDMGPGALARLLESGVAHTDITHILITHFHTDHASDLAAFFQAMAIEPRERPLTLVGPPGFSDFIEEFLGCFNLGDRDWPRLEGIFEAGKTALETGPFTVAASRVEHKEESTAYRVTGPGGKTLAYSGDTGLCDGIVEIGRDADLLVLECSLPDEYGIDMHLTPTKAAEVAERANPKKVALTHLYPVWETRDMEAEIAAAFRGRPFIIAEDGMSVEV